MSVNEGFMLSHDSVFTFSIWLPKRKLQLTILIKSFGIDFWVSFSFLSFFFLCLSAYILNIDQFVRQIRTGQSLKFLTPKPVRIQKFDSSLDSENSTYFAEVTEN